jgi:hypothetical protein
MLARVASAEVDAPEAVLDLCTARGIAFVPLSPQDIAAIGKR